MAASLYLGATAPYSGKNTIVLGMGLWFQNKGVDVGYMKPVGAVPTERDGATGDADAFFVMDALDLSQNPTDTTPVLVTEEFKKKAFSGKYGECLADINQAYNRLAEDRDLMLVAGSGSMHAGRYCQVDGVTVSQSLGSKVVVIDRFQKELQYDFLLVLKEMLGDDLAGVILNAVPASFMEELRYQITPFLESKGVKMLGVLPQDPVLGSIKVRDLAGRIDGKQLEPGGEDRIVENFLIGTMQVENFLTHFKKTRNAAVIVGGDRSDVQLVALEGNCACLVLTGNLYPNDIIQTRAEVLEIPLIMVREDTYTVAKKMEHVIATHKLRDEVKYKEAAQLVGNRLDMEHLRQVLGV